MMKASGVMLLLALLMIHSVSFQQTHSFSFDIFGAIVQFFQNLINSISGNKTTSAPSTTIASTTIAKTTTTSTTSITQSNSISNSQTGNNIPASNSLTSVNTSAQTTACNGASYSACQSYCQANPLQCGSPSLPFAYTLAQMYANVIVANPVNLSQLASYHFAISKYRSCAGHDFAGYNYNGTYENESSMKHYFAQIGNVGNSTVTSHIQTLTWIQLFAPFNGTVLSEPPYLGAPYGVGLIMVSTSDPLIGITFFHITPLVDIGSTVTAGQLLGYTADGGTFDMALNLMRPQGAPRNVSDPYAKNGIEGTNDPYAKNSTGSLSISQVLDSIFNHMSPQVLAQYQAYGINRSNIVLPWSARVAVPCNYVNDTRTGHSASAGPHQNALWNWVNLTTH